MYYGAPTNILKSTSQPQSLSLLVSGRYRPLYFKSPLVAQMASNLPLEESNILVNQQLKKEKTKEEPPKFKEAVIQTDYRDSESQTLPYTPKFIVKEGENPEILSLMHLKYNKGLPASIDELDAIELAREKIWFESSLPPISDEGSFALRRRLMDDMEFREWQKKENEIKKFIKLK